MDTRRMRVVVNGVGRREKHTEARKRVKTLWRENPQAQEKAEIATRPEGNNAKLKPER